VIDCHTHIGEPDHVSAEFVEDVRRVWGQDLRFPPSLDDHLELTSAARRAVVLGFRARASGFVVPNEYVASYVGRFPDRFVGFGASIWPRKARPRRSSDARRTWGFAG
jgi:hypothetical protein